MIEVDKAALFSQLICGSVLCFSDKLLILSAVYILQYVRQKDPHSDLYQPMHLNYRSGYERGQIVPSLLPRNCWPKKIGIRVSTHSGDTGEVYSEHEY